MADGHRQTQEEKSKQMRRRLVEATLDCLQARGYHGSSLSQILARAGVSRGAWRHHFGSKKALMAAAAEHFLSSQIEKARELTERMNPNDAHLEFLTNYIWETFYQGPRRDIWLEFHVACRTDKGLRRQLMTVFQDFFASLDELWRTYFEATGRSDSSVEVLMNLTLYVLRGMAIQSLIIEAQDHYENLRSQWVRMLSPLIDIRTDQLPSIRRFKTD